MTPIQPSDQSSQIYQTQTPQEKQKLFELQFEIAVLSIYISASAKNGDLKHQLSKIKDGLKEGQSLHQLSSQLNQLIDQINVTTNEGKAPFPSLAFTTEGNQAQALSYHAISLEKILNVTAEFNHIQWSQENPLFSELSDYIDNVAHLPSAQAFETFNSLIEKANKVLPAEFHLPTIPFESRS